jgi:hypothetical protein
MPHMTERLSDITQPPEHAQPETLPQQPESPESAITVDPLELARDGVMFSMDHHGIDRKSGFQLINSWQSKK